MTTRSQKRKAVTELVSGDFELSLNENNSIENPIPSSSKNPRLELENLEEMKTTLRKEIMTDLTKILAENQKEMLKLIAPTSKKRSVSLNIQDSDSDQENISVTRTSTPVKTRTATSSKTTPNNSRNIYQIGNQIPVPFFSTNGDSILIHHPVEFVNSAHACLHCSTEPVKKQPG